MTYLVSLMHTGDSISGSYNCYPFQAFGLVGLGDSTAREYQAVCSYRISSDLIFRNMAVSATHLTGGDPGDLDHLITGGYIDGVLPGVNYTIPPFDRQRKYIFTTGIGTNDLAIGSHGTGNAALYAVDVATMCAARKAAGYNLVGIGTLLPRTTGFIDNQDRIDFNACITDSSWRAAHGVDFCIDLAGETTMGNQANTTSATYYEQTGVDGYLGTGGVHPTTAGAALLAPVYFAAVTAAITSLGGASLVDEHGSVLTDTEGLSLSAD